MTAIKMKINFNDHRDDKRGRSQRLGRVQIQKMLKRVEHESAPGMKISLGRYAFLNTNSFRMGISASYSSK